MSQLTEKVSYLRGLMEGMKLDTETNEGLLLSKIVDVLDSMAQEIADLSAAQDELSEYVDSIDQDLAAVEELFEEEDDEADEEAYDEYDEAEGCSGDCSSCAGCGDAMADENYEVDVVVECMCPQCSGTFYVNEDELGDDAFHICPRCGARIHVVPDYDADIPVAALADDEDKDE